MSSDLSDGVWLRRPIFEILEEKFRLHQCNKSAIPMLPKQHNPPLSQVDIGLSQLSTAKSETEYYEHLSRTDCAVTSSEFKQVSARKSTPQRVPAKNDAHAERTVSPGAAGDQGDSIEVDEHSLETSRFVEGLLNGVWMAELQIRKDETRYFVCVARMLKRTVKKAKPFNITRPPPVNAVFVPLDQTVSNANLWTQILIAVQKSESQTTAEIAMKTDFVRRLNELIANVDHEQLRGAKLSIFGSTYNGFGNSGSDLDLAMLYEEPWMRPKNRTIMDIVNSLSKVLRQPQFFNVIKVTQVIRSARVPIIKFISVSPDYPALSGDICVDNYLGPRNTRLMSAYATYDERLRTLGYGIKKFAKLADINDASAGSLSSYAYLLMMIYYLQKVTPPILPCLQDVTLCKPHEEPLRMENDMNTWYQSDLDYVRGVASEVPPNRSSVGELWLGFFNFYNRFDFRTQIDIRLRENPTVRRVAVEIRDPFDEDHDLARVLRLSGENLVRNCFHSALDLFRRVKLLDNELSGKDKLGLFQWLVEQVANSHPFEQMNTCWLCGEGDHYKSVCHIFSERKRLDALSLESKHRISKRTRKVGSKDETTGEKDRLQKGGGNGIARRQQLQLQQRPVGKRGSNDVGNINKQMSTLNPRNGMALFSPRWPQEGSALRPSHNFQNMQPRLTPQMMQQRNYHSLQYTVKPQNVSYNNGFTMPPPQYAGYFPTPPPPTQMRAPFVHPLSHSFPRQQYAQYISPRFMQDPTVSPRGHSGNDFYQNVMPRNYPPNTDTMQQPSVHQQQNLKQPFINDSDRRIYAKNQNRTLRNPDPSGRDQIQSHSKQGLIYPKNYYSNPGQQLYEDQQYPRGKTYRQMSPGEGLPPGFSPTHPSKRNKAEWK